MTLHLNYSGEISLDSFAKSLSEKVLLNLLAENLDDNFVFLMLKYGDIVLQSVKHMRLCYDDIQEVKQLTFHNAYFAMKDYSGDDIRLIRSLQGWLCEIAKNLALNLLSKSKKGKYISYERTFQAREQEDSVLNGPEERAIDTEYLRAVYEYINLLPKKYGDLLKCLATYEISYFDLAQMLGIPVGTLKSRVAKARKLLQQVMREEQTRREGN